MYVLIAIIFSLICLLVSCLTGINTTNQSIQYFSKEGYSLLRSTWNTLQNGCEVLNSKYVDFISDQDTSMLGSTMNESMMSEDDELKYWTDYYMETEPKQSLECNDEDTFDEISLNEKELAFEIDESKESCESFLDSPMLQSF